MLFRRKVPPAPPPPPPLRWDTVPEAPGRFSSGIGDLDAALGAGFAIGSSVAVEADSTVGNEDALILAVPALANFLSLGRGATVVPPAALRPDRFRESALRCIPSDTFDTRVRVLDYTSADRAQEWVVPMARYGRAESMRALITAERTASGAARGPILEFNALDTLENTTNSTTAVRMFTYGLGHVKEVGNFAMVWLRAGSAGAGPISGMTDYYLRLSRSEGALWLRGVRPSMPARTIRWNEGEGALRVELGLPGSASA